MWIMTEAERGDKITVRVILEESGINRSTFYAYYDNVRSVYDAICGEFVRCARELLIPAGRDARLLQMLTDWVRFCRKNRRAYLIMHEIPPVAFRAYEVEDLLRGKKPTAELAAEAGELAVRDAIPMKNNHYKVEALKTLVRDYVLSLA